MEIGWCFADVRLTTSASALQNTILGQNATAVQGLGSVRSGRPREELPQPFLFVAVLTTMTSSRRCALCLNPFQMADCGRRAALLCFEADALVTHRKSGPYDSSCTGAVWDNL